MSSQQETSSTQPPAALRIWPAIVFLALLWILRLGPGFFAEKPPTLIMAAFFGPALCSLLIWLWWVFASRASRRERWLGLAGIISLLVVSTALSHPTLRGFGTLGSALPWGSTGFAVGLLVAHWTGMRRRTAVALFAASLGFFYWTLVRADGMWGNFSTEHHWRWQQTTEDAFLAELGERGAAKVAAGGELGEVEWPGFRGPGRNSVVPGVILGEDWKAKPPHELWRISVGPGWSSFAVAGDRLFTQEQRGESEVVVSYDATSGAEIWIYEYSSRFVETMGGVGPRATPSLSDGQLYTLGAEGLLHRIDPLTGSSAWQADLRVDAGREPPTWGFASSPLVVDKTVIVHAGGEGDRGVLGYDAETGKLRWGVPAGGHSYSSPQLSVLAGKRSVPVVTDSGLTLIEPADGSVLLQYPWPFNDYRVLQPLVLDSSIFMSTGIGIGTRRIDFSLEGGKLKAEDRWTSRAMKPDFNDYVAHKGHLYGFDPSIMACMDLETGEKRWKGGRYGNAQILLLPDSDQLLVLAETGDIVLVRANPEKHDELTRFEVLNGKTWNHPVLVGNRLFVRNGQEAVGLELP